MSKTKRLVLDALLIALFFVLSSAAVTIGGIKLTFASLPGILAAMLFGPIDGFVVGSAHRPWVYYAVNLVTAVVVSLGNTLVYYLDSILYDYYSYALIFGVLGMRILTGLLSTLLTSTVALPVLAALRKANLVRARA